MGIEEVPYRLKSLLRRAGLSEVPRAVLVTVGALCLVLVVVAFARFWPASSSDTFELSGSQSVQTLEASSGSAASASDSAAGASTLQATGSTAGAFVVDVEGAVVSPGVKTLSSDARVQDAVEAAGGFTKKASRRQVNLAQKLSDGMQVYIPSKAKEGSGGSSTGSSSTGEAEKVNLNTADLEKLQTLSGIGPSLAQRIIDYREQNGAFASVDDLKNVSGIGDVRFESLKDKVCV